MRVGQGLDAHRFGDGDHVILGGVRIPHDRGLVAHSDGDVALHALCDAMLGAAALGDIGRHFPPGDDRWAGADSRDLVRRVRVKLGEQGWLVVNADLTVVCESPRVGAHVESMRANIAADLEVDRQRVSVKATTTDTMGFLGRDEGVAAMAVVALSEI